MSTLNIGIDMSLSIKAIKNIVYISLLMNEHITIAN